MYSFINSHIYPYTENKNLIAYFENNKDTLSEYSDSFNSESYTNKTDDDIFGEIRYYDVPKELQKIKIYRIEYMNSCLFFEVELGKAYYGGIYYSFKDELAEYTPLGDWTSIIIYDEAFKEKRQNVFIKDNKKNSDSLYKTGKIDDNWYYHEFYWE